MGKTASQRNVTVDILRGLAMLLVVLGHTLTGCINDVEHSFLYNIIWALQMPLFILISGYVTKYSERISNVKSLWKVIQKRTIAYMLPWLVWTFVIRGLILRNYEYLNLKWLVFHMDSGYWYLFSIWIISLMYSLSLFLAGKVKIDGVGNVAAFLTFFGCLTIILLIVGKRFGLSFLGTKLTLYYIPFYLCGVMYGRYQYLFEKHQWIKDAIIAVSLVLFISIVMRYYLYDLDETIGNVLIRIIASLTGCIAICGLVKPICNKKSFFILERLKYIGTHSIEIYLTHYILLTPIKRMAENAIEMFWIPIINFVATMLLCILIIYLIEQNRFLSKALYGKSLVTRD